MLFTLILVLYEKTQITFWEVNNLLTFTIPKLLPTNGIPQKRKLFVKMAAVAVSLIPVAKNLKVAYTLFKALQEAKAEEDIPETADKVADYALKKNGAAMKGWQGGGKFANDGRDGGEILDQTDADGNPITYREYEIWPSVPGQNRRTERVVIGTDKSAYYYG
jgi:hypothetical protein